ncbi:MAG TPA: hypothetical protein PLZ57_02940 [Pseudobdellovibrionaceae bacterium]|nr:hypothetical protein [Pseudobdellovibrionaceae bacterium]
MMRALKLARIQKLAQLIGMCFSLILSLSSVSAFAQKSSTALNGFQPIERIAVFPIKLDQQAEVDQLTRRSLEEAWWQVREELVGTGRFTVASRSFLMRADSFQARGQMEAADVVILSKHLNAEAVFTLRLEGRRLILAAWEGRSGHLLWDRSTELHASILIREQIGKVARELTREFIAAIPYQGIGLVDSLTGQAVVEDGDLRIARVELGQGTELGEGDLVQWINLERVNLKPLLSGGLQARVLAEGRILKIEDRVAQVELTRIQDLRSVRSGAPVRIPKEAERLAALVKFKDQQVGGAGLAPLLALEGVKAEESSSQKKPLATTLSILGSLAAVLLLAF